jgi:hypothetical protein
MKNIFIFFIIILSGFLILREFYFQGKTFESEFNGKVISITKGNKGFYAIDLFNKYSKFEIRFKKNIQSAVDLEIEDSIFKYKNSEKLYIKKHNSNTVEEYKDVSFEYSGR